MREIVKVLFLMFLLSVPAMAQVTTTLDPNQTYFPVILFTSPTFGQCLGSSISGSGAWCFALNPSNTTLPTGVPISLFSTKTELNAVSANISQSNLEIDRLFSLAAVSAALQDAIPNTGDRFAFKLNAAGFKGTLAGAVGVSANLGRMTRFSFNYGQAKSERIFSGGFNISIH